MPIIAAVALLQIACAVHCVRHGGNRMWLMVVIFLPVAGSLAYIAFEVLPGFAGNRQVRRVKAAANRAIDPERDLRAAREALELADTAANRIALGDAYADLGRWADAIPQYEAADAKAPAAERSTRFKLAKACFEAGRYERARTLVDSLPASLSQTEIDRADLLNARLLEQAGETAEALALYESLGARVAGGEPQCRQAALLMALGRRSEAVPLLVEVEQRLKRLDRLERASKADMYDWAAATLAEIRRG
jgi:hypothetical protein